MNLRTSEMHVLAGPLLDWAKRKQNDLEAVYQENYEEHAYWCLLDLRASAAYRQISGSRQAYIRGEVFQSLIKLLSEAHTNVLPFKEMGDGVIVRSLSLRPILEICCALDSLSRSWSQIDSRTGAPELTFSAALTSGPCSALTGRSVPDYVGRPLDLLARISSYRTNRDDMLLVADADISQYGHMILSDEMPFLALGTPLLLPSALQKPGEAKARVVEVTINRQLFDGHKDGFVPIRDLFSEQHPNS